MERGTVDTERGFPAPYVGACGGGVGLERKDTSNQSTSKILKKKKWTTPGIVVSERIVCMSECEN